MTSARDDARGPDEGPGGRLRQERLERGLSDQQVADQLNLDVVVIQAIEDNDFPALGAPVFARGHLRRYATVLGVPEADVLAAYDRSRQPETPTLVPRAHFERLPERHAPRWPWILGGLAVLLIVCGVIAFVGSADDFDFWLGRWRASWGEDGAHGTNTITKEYGGRVVYERFDGRPGAEFTGMSVSVYDEADGCWYQTWVDDAGSHLHAIRYAD